MKPWYRAISAAVAAATASARAMAKTRALFALCPAGPVTTGASGGGHGSGDTLFSRPRPPVVTSTWTSMSGTRRLPSK
jgi:hypothetical protein